MIRTFHDQTLAFLLDDYSRAEYMQMHEMARINVRLMNVRRMAPGVERDGTLTDLRRAKGVRYQALRRLRFIIRMICDEQESRASVEAIRRRFPDEYVMD